MNQNSRSSIFRVFSILALLTLVSACGGSGGGEGDVVIDENADALARRAAAKQNYDTARAARSAELAGASNTDPLAGSSRGSTGGQTSGSYDSEPEGRDTKGILMGAAGAAAAGAVALLATNGLDSPLNLLSSDKSDAPSTAGAAGQSPLGSTSLSMESFSPESLAAASPALMQNLLSSPSPELLQAVQPPPQEQPSSAATIPDVQIINSDTNDSEETERSSGNNDDSGVVVVETTKEKGLVYSNSAAANPPSTLPPAAVESISIMTNADSSNSVEGESGPVPSSSVAASTMTMADALPCVPPTDLTQTLTDLTQTLSDARQVTVEAHLQVVGIKTLKPVGKGIRENE